MAEKLEAGALIHLHGGTNAVARIMGCTPGAVSHWRKRGVPKNARRVLELLAGISA